MVEQVKKFAIVTRAYEISEMSRISHPIINSYAEKCDADFLIISEAKIKIGPFHNEIYQCHDLLDKYERICVIDSDVIINQSTPNIFKLVPSDHIGVVYEDVGFRKYSRRNRIKEIQDQFGDVNWKKGYINTGFIVFSNIHKNIFKINKKKIWNNLGYDDVQIGYNIKKNNYLIKELDYRFNHMSLFSEGGKSWLGSYIIHYAGRGFYRNIPREKQMMKDLNSIKEHSSFTIQFLNIMPRIRLIFIGLIGYFGEFIFNKIKK